MIEAREITKRYGERTVLDHASLAVGPGEAVVLTGDNGSGKTTLLHVLVGLRRAEGGCVVWKGQSLTGSGGSVWRRARAAWGFLPQQVALPRTARVGHALHFHARLRGTSLDRARHWLDRVGLAGAENQTIGALSGGMQQRLGIALTLFFEPELVVMDEPASSLDPGWRGELVRWTAEQTGRGAAVLVTSQWHESWGEAVRFCHCEAGRVIGDATHPDTES